MLFNRQTSAAAVAFRQPIPLGAWRCAGAWVRCLRRVSQLPDGCQYIPATPTLSGRPVQQGTQNLVFQLFVPAGDKPAGGWPVASVFASRGIATLSINVVGHAGGARRARGHPGSGAGERARGRARTRRQRPHGPPKA
jgi:hypothetical protein